MTPKNDESKDRPAESVAAPAENAGLEHTAGGVTTRDDRLDAGVPMAPAPDPEAERVGPEDAMGPEPTRGDYSGRIDAGPHLTAVATSAEEAAGEEHKGKGDDAGHVERGPSAKLVEQGPAPDVG